MRIQHLVITYIDDTDRMQFLLDGLFITKINLLFFISDDNRKWESPLLPFIPYPTSCHSDRPLPSIPNKPLRLGQRLHLGMTMADPDTGVPVPTLAMTIHPQTGSVYPLGRLHVCPLTRMPQPIQIGYPMLDSRTGNIVLTVGVTLDSVTGESCLEKATCVYHTFPLLGLVCVFVQEMCCQWVE